MYTVVQFSLDPGGKLFVISFFYKINHLHKATAQILCLYDVKYQGYISQTNFPLMYVYLIYMCFIMTKYSCLNQMNNQSLSQILHITKMTIHVEDKKRNHT